MYIYIYVYIGFVVKEINLSYRNNRYMGGNYIGVYRYI